MSKNIEERIVRMIKETLEITHKDQEFMMSLVDEYGPEKVLDTIDVIKNKVGLLSNVSYRRIQRCEWFIRDKYNIPDPDDAPDLRS